MLCCGAVYSPASVGCGVYLYGVVCGVLQSVNIKAYQLSAAAAAGTGAWPAPGAPQHGRF